MERGFKILNLIKRLHETLPLAGMKLVETRLDDNDAANRYVYIRENRLLNGAFAYYVEVSFDNRANSNMSCKQVNVKSELLQIGGFELVFGNEELLVKPDEEHSVIDEVNKQLEKLFKLIDSIVQTLGVRRIAG